MLYEGGWSKPRHAPAAFLLGKARYSLYSRLGGLQGRSGRVLKISPPPGLDPRTVQPVASRYTDWTILRYLTECGRTNQSNAQLIIWLIYCCFNYSSMFRPLSDAIIRESSCPGELPTGAASWWNVTVWMCQRWGAHSSHTSTRATRTTRLLDDGFG
jgi:hypothetical protein